MSPELPSSVAGGLTLAALALEVEQDVVSLCRRARALAEEFGLADDDIRRLTAASYEAGRVLCNTRRPGTAELAVGNEPSFRVVFRCQPETGECDRLSELVGSLRGLVHHVVFERNGGQATFELATLFPAERLIGRHSSGSAAHRPEAAGVPGSPADAPDLARLQRAYTELQAELHETNRGVVALYADLDDRAERLRQAEDRLRLLLDSVHDYAICMLGDDGEITSWNAGAERLFGYSAEEIIGRNFACFYPDAERDNLLPLEHLREAREQGRVELECLRMRHGGSAFYAHVLITPVRAAGGHLQGFSLVVRDVTERCRLEDDLRRRAEELAAANRAKEDFLATLSHELRTPLNAMLGWTRLLRMGRLDAKGVARALETIERNARLQEQLISDILDVSRIVTGKLRLDLRPIELAPVVEAALDSARPAAEAKGLALVSHVTFDGTVLGDPDRLQQVVWNLLANAIKFTEAGGQISVAVDRSGSSAVLTVSDTGDGIAPDVLPYIFDRFRQGDTSVTRPHGGLGLGLSIVRHITELHGGSVQVSSAGPGQGATFSMYLPVLAIKTRRRRPGRSGR